MSDEIIFRGPPSTCLPLEKSLGHHILKCLSLNRDKVFQHTPVHNQYTYFSTSYTRGEIKTLSIRVALQLQRLGLNKGDILTLCTRNHKNTVLPFLAAIYLGATVNPVDEALNNFELKRMIQNTKPKMILCDESAEEKFTKILAELNLKLPIYLCDKDFERKFLIASVLEDLFEPAEVDIHTTNALILCSSGTTGLMKGVAHTHYSFYHSVCDTGYVAKENDIFLSGATLVWNIAPWLIIYCIIFGSTQVILDWHTQTVEQTVAAIQKYDVNFLITTPGKLAKLMAYDDFKRFPKLKDLRVIWSRGSPNTKAQMERAREIFPNTHVVNAIGCTEMAMLIVYFDPETQYDLNIKKVYSNGTLCPGVIAKVIDVATGKNLGKNEQGELLLKAESMTPGYYNNPEVNKNAFTEDGWYRTGDLVYFDDDECLFVVGRLKEIIKYNTICVSPAEVEYIINQHPAVKESCVMGIPDETCGELPMAFIIKHDNVNVTENEIIKFVDEHAADFERLRGGVRFINEFPRTASGKIRRFELQKLLEIK